MIIPKDMESLHYNDRKGFQSFLEQTTGDMADLKHHEFLNLLRITVMHNEIIERSELLLFGETIDNSDLINRLVENRPASVSIQSVANCLYRAIIDALSKSRLDFDVIVTSVPLLLYDLTESPLMMNHLRLHLAYACGPICAALFQTYVTFSSNTLRSLIDRAGPEDVQHPENHILRREDLPLDPTIRVHAGFEHGGVRWWVLDHGDGDEGGENENESGVDANSVTIPLSPPDTIPNALHMAARSDCPILLNRMVDLVGPSAFSQVDSEGNLILHAAVGRTTVNFKFFLYVLKQSLVCNTHLGYGGLLKRNNEGKTPIDLLLRLIRYSDMGDDDRVILVGAECRLCMSLVSDVSKDIFHHVIPSKDYYAIAMKGFWNRTRSTVRDTKNMQLPLHIAVRHRLGWTSGMSDIFHSYQPALETIDPVSGLYPALLAAVGEEPDLDVIYLLFRENPLIYLAGII